MKRFSNYLKSRRIGWWISNGILVFIIVLLLVPSWRLGVISFFQRLTLRDPQIISVHERPTLPANAWDFSYRLLDDSKHSIKAHKGEVIFINFWATWCPPCVAEMSSIEDLYKAYKDKVHFVVYSKQHKQVIKAFADQKKYDLPFACTLYGVPDYFNKISAIPATYIISKAGDIVVMESGAKNWNADNIHKTLDKLIKE